jgi:hypothetical protein
MRQQLYRIPAGQSNGERETHFSERGCPVRQQPTAALNYECRFLGKDRSRYALRRTGCPRSMELASKLASCE